MNEAPVCNHDLPLPPRTTLADALHGYRDFKKPLSIEPSYFAARQGTGAPWTQHFEARDRELRELVKAQCIDQARDARVMVNVSGEFRRELEAVLPIMADRRGIAHTVARRLQTCAPLASSTNARDLTELPQQMFLCRVDGHACETDDGERRFAWPYKCSSTRFCPDCAREHSAWEALRYGERLLELVQLPGVRVHQAVFTRPSVELGRMREGVEETLQMFRAWLDHKRRCSAVQRRKHGWGPRKRKLPTWQPGQQTREEVKNGRTRTVYDGPGIVGALVQVECHLTAKGAWHPHLNVLLVTKGDFSYALARRLWGFNVEFQPVRGDAANLARSFAELIKYPFRHVAEKSQAKADAGETQAPPFEEWPDHAIVEWHAATRAIVECGDGQERVQGARWLRSYGALHGIPPPEVKLEELHARARVTFTDDGCYALSLGAFVGSIPGSKFPCSAPTGQKKGYRVPTIRPPPRLNRPPGEP